MLTLFENHCKSFLRFVSKLSHSEKEKGQVFRPPYTPLWHKFYHRWISLKRGVHRGSACIVKIFLLLIVPTPRLTPVTHGNALCPLQDVRVGDEIPSALHLSLLGRFEDR